jgi:RNA polymerase sigma-70 factor (ECF subfamily)
MTDFAQDPGRWLAEARAGDREALGQALEACRRYLLLVAEREIDADLRAKGGASDLVQETFLEAQRDFRGFAGTSEAELRAWLRRLLLNNLSHFTRRYRATGKRAVGREVGLQAEGSADTPLPEPAADTPSPSVEAMAHEQAVALRQALERLPEDYRQVIVLRYLEGRSFEEIGRLLNRSPDAARKLWARAMERFREEWEGAP